MTCAARMTIAAALAFCGGFALAWWLTSMPPAVPSIAAPLPEAPQARAIPQVEKPCQKVIVYRDRPIPLPAAKPTEQATATARLQAKDDRLYSLVTTLDPDTGASRIWARAEPAPWFAFEDKRYLGIGYGLREDGRAVGVLHGGWSLARSKDLHLGINAQADTGGRGVIWADLDWRF